MILRHIDKKAGVFEFEDSAGNVIVLRMSNDKLELVPQSRRFNLLLTTGRYGQIYVGVM